MPRRVLQDAYFRQAKRDGYLARSAYKLLELNDRFKLIRAGDAVLDLGCAPGSWLQVAAELTGPSGVVIGIDLTPVAAPIAPHVRTVVGDLTATPPRDLLDLIQTPDEPRRFDAVVSDMAPNTSGHGDHYRSVRLCREALERAPGLLRPGGSLTMKVLEGEELHDLRAEAGALFADARVSKPKASRDVSRETYVVARNLLASRPTRPETSEAGETP